MKKSVFKYCILISVLIFSGWIRPVQAQPEIAGKDVTKLIEKSVLVTDRETYCVDEDILFSAFNISSLALRNAAWSNVLYVELISPNGEAFVRRKYKYNEIGTNGSLRIPNNMLTGNYYLRAYTRWMRDYSPYNYFYKMVKVINPFRPELLETSGNAILNESEVKIPLPNTTDLFLKIDRKNYNKRDQVKIEISAAEHAWFTDKFVVSVIPKGTEIALVPKLSDMHDLKFSPDFIPETRGLSISGKIVSFADSVPLPYTLVGLTIFKENPENRNILTNEKGQFFFDLSKLEGEYEIFISAQSKENQSPLILVDNDFSTQDIKLPYVSFDLSSESKKLYQLLSFNSQIQTLYRQQKIEEALKSFSSDSSFYGEPDFILKLGDYISLPSIKDYIYELVPQVGVRHDGKRTILKVLGNYSELGVYSPLVLVDMVPIFDVEKVLELQTDKIDRIEVVTTPYIRGDIVFGGIVSLFSKKGDLAGIDLPAAGRFITYNMLSPELIQSTPDQKNQHIPDLRNCLYWNPDLKLKGPESSKVSFNAGDCSGDYMIVIHGMDKTGTIKVATVEITVK